MFEQKKYSEVIIEDQAEKIEAAHELINEIIADQVKIGEGQNAEIFFSGDQARQDFCVKQLKESPARRHYQSIVGEMKLQEQARKLGVRVPQPILALTTEEDESFMVMETIKGKSLYEMVAQKVKPPVAYDHEKYWGMLDSMLKRLHDERIYHRDLHLGNIMIDFESGDPVLIDFGWSAYVPGGDNPYREINTNISHQEDFPNDDQELRKCKREFAQYLTNLDQ
ncbi:MAG: phosphotransferase [Candidatus Veblenbacteria bacterium]|nr:phosphotransferase [Candidatus Veblenbacteria bacterium]